jgi:tetratricopeptide (TPR) repeat protein
MDDAELEARSMLTVTEDLYGPSHYKTALALNQLALALEAQGREEEGDVYFARALAIRDAVSANAKLYDKMRDDEPLALDLLYDGPRIASFTFRQLDREMAALGPDCPEIVPELLRIAEESSLSCCGEHAAPAYRRVLAIREQALGPDHPEVTDTLILLAEKTDWYEHDYAEAIRLYRRALAIREGAFGPHHPQAADVLRRLGGVYYHSEDFAQAEALLLRALAIQEEALPPDHEDIGWTCCYLCDLYERQGKTAEAQAFMARYESILDVPPF